MPKKKKASGDKKLEPVKSNKVDAQELYFLEPLSYNSLTLRQVAVLCSFVRWYEQWPNTSAIRVMS